MILLFPFLVSAAVPPPLLRPRPSSPTVFSIRHVFLICAASAVRAPNRRSPFRLSPRPLTATAERIGHEDQRRRRRRRRSPRRRAAAGNINGGLAYLLRKTQIPLRDTIHSPQRNASPIASPNSAESGCATAFFNVPHSRSTPRPT